MIVIREKGMLDGNVDELELEHLFKNKEALNKEDDSDLEKFNQCHGYRGRFCSSGGGGGGGGGGLSIETEGSTLLPGSGGGALGWTAEEAQGDYYVESSGKHGGLKGLGGYLPLIEPNTVPAPPMPTTAPKGFEGKKLIDSDRAQLAPYVGQTVAFNGEVSKHSQTPYGVPTVAIQNIAVKAQDGREMLIDHAWSKHPNPMLANTPILGVISGHATVEAYPKDDGYTYGLKKIRKTHEQPRRGMPKIDGGKVDPDEGKYATKARMELKQFEGKDVKVTYTVDKVGQGKALLKDVTTTGIDSKIAVHSDTVHIDKATPTLLKAKPGTKQSASAIVKKYYHDTKDPASKGVDFTFDKMIIKTVKKGIDVGDVHVPGPSWKGKKRSEMTKEELAECEKARANCPKLKKSVELYKLDEEQKLIYGVVLVPDVEDLQGDVCSKEDIQEAAHDYLVNSRLVKAQHRAPTDADVVECYIAPVDIPIGKGIAPAGSWVMVTKVNSAAMWTAIKKGDITGYSIGGRGTREEI